MPYSRYFINESTLTSIADAVRNLTGKSLAFTPAQMISEINNYETKYISEFEYMSRNDITSFTDDTAEVICERAFYYCPNLSSISFKRCSYISPDAFMSCYSLTNISLPECKIIGESTFYYCDWLTSITLPKCEYVGNSTFACCSRLTTVLLPKCKFIGSYTFNNCTALTSLYLNQVSNVVSTVSGYTAYNIFNNGNIPNIYVPNSLLTAFQTNSVWSYYSSYIYGV